MPRTAACFDFLFFCYYVKIMNIIIIGTAYPYRGGLAAFNERLAIQLQNEGHNVSMYTFTLQYPSFLFPGKTQYTNSHAPLQLNIKRCVNSCNPFNWLSIGRMISNQNPDLVIFAYWMSFMAPCFGTIARRIKCKKNIRCIGLMHNMMPHDPNVLDKFLPNYFVSAMDGFVALSKSVVKDIDKIDKFNKPKCWSPHPIYDHYGNIITKEDARRRLGLDIDGKYVLFFGFIREYKGFDLLIDAISDSRLQNMGVKLLVAGEFYGDSQSYMNRINSLNISDAVVLHNVYIPDSDVNLFFCAADLVAQPYKSATQSGVTQIAFHFEKPMLVTNVGGLPEIVPDGKVGYVVEPDVQSIADAIARFYTDGDEDTLVQGVRQEKQKYAWSNMSQVILEVLK